MRNEIKEFYYKDKQKQEEKKRRKESENYNPIEEEDSIDDYLNDNSQKRVFLKFYHFFETEYKYIICPIKEVNEKDDDNDSDNSSKINKSINEDNKSKYSNYTNNNNIEEKDKDKEIDKDNNIKDQEKENNENKIMKFSPSKIIIKEKTSNFLKWISSIFQTINDSNITDYANVI
jgi:hypothetical protein